MNLSVSYYRLNNVIDNVLLEQMQVIHVHDLPLFSAPLGYVSNFKVTSYTSTSIDVEWSPIVGATEYKLSWKSGDIFTHYFLCSISNMGTIYVFTGQSNLLSVCILVREPFDAFKDYISKKTGMGTVGVTQYSCIASNIVLCVSVLMYLPVYR